ncbi:uncharacterized protein LOC115891754 isoform X2 [Sitophilus oryzae]|nr:uncharacterized protein LOC115891754 isoform X2 [Sitophilus oryzae]
MQSDELDKPIFCPTLPLPEKMTYSEPSSMTIPEKLLKNSTPKAEPPSSPMISNINLEDDIEKVEVESKNSSKTSKEENPVTSCKLPPTTAREFPGIPEESPNESVKNWLQKINEIHTTKKTTSSTVQQQINSTRIVKYQDLPYMGEITLDNSKPRRGRKPKKADICHLIYKNYGTIFPGTPNANIYLEKDSNQNFKKQNVTMESDFDLVNRNDVQSKIISSLLEKRLTQESKNYTSEPKEDQNEPLNLCIRDLNHLKIGLMDSNEKPGTELKLEAQSDSDIEIINETPSPKLRNDLKFPPTTPHSTSTSSPDIPLTPEGTSEPGGYMYWPNAGVFIHPLALQQQLMMYQRLAKNMNCPIPSTSPRPGPNPNEIEIEEPSDQLRKIVPKLPKQINKVADSSSLHKPKRNASLNFTDKTSPAKRKRSAIFIPPIPMENSTNPATEVSICKFKFTGGAKPSLQEKKMLSVDSGGNFRYYSGTGDKSMRGYEFFPRETLQQQISSTQGSSTGAFLQASGEKMYPLSPLDSTSGSGACSNTDFLLTTELPSTALTAIQQETSGNSASALRNKKRKSKKSLQREKLEQTFKEKGFLIQTQQLESAEGATYCKFRQLRKFTRYLFRSWKDYLPDNVRDIQENEYKELYPPESVDMASDSLDSISVKSCDLTAGPS